MWGVFYTDCICFSFSFAKASSLARLLNLQVPTENRNCTCELVTVMLENERDATSRNIVRKLIEMALHFFSHLEQNSGLYFCHTSKAHTFKTMTLSPKPCYSHHDILTQSSFQVIWQFEILIVAVRLRPYHTIYFARCVYSEGGQDKGYSLSGNDHSQQWRRKAPRAISFLLEVRVLAQRMVMWCCLPSLFT